MNRTNTLASLVQRGVHRAPLRILLYGAEGIGKTTWASGAPSPVFIGTEDGYGDLDVARLPAPQSWSDVGRYVSMLLREPHDFRTVVIDTVDHLERLVWAAVTEDHDGKSIESIPYGKGYIEELERFARLAQDLDAVRTKRGMHVILLGHAVTKTMKNPEGPDYDRHGLKIHKASSEFWREWCDVVLFAQLDITVKSNERGDKALFGRGKATGGGRIINTLASPAFEAKNRYGLPAEIKMEWADFARAVKLDLRSGGAAMPDDLVERVRGTLTDAGLLDAFGDVYGDPRGWTPDDVEPIRGAMKRAAEAAGVRNTPKGWRADAEKIRVAAAGVLAVERDRLAATVPPAGGSAEE